jgi:hypothetical protein
LGALHRTLALQEKEHTTLRQLRAATTTKSDGKKVEGLQYKLDALQRSRQDLEEIVASTFTTVFLNRYRDSSPFIRAENIAALSQIGPCRRYLSTLQQPNGSSQNFRGVGFLCVL